MCGITGGVWLDPAQALDGPTLQRMIDRLAHRGPDDEGRYTGSAVMWGRLPTCQPTWGRLPTFQEEPLPPPIAQDESGRLAPSPTPSPGVALGHRRLAVIDVAGARQPLANEDGTIWVVLNGEIYNFRDLRRRLEAQGHRFRTQGDTEVLVHLYEQHGPDMLEQLNGMFALALWDAPRRQLLLARDRLGEKPLVYRHEPGRLLFASELKSLLEVPGLPREIDPGALDEYLTYQYVPHPHCILRGFAKLPPGHVALWREGRLDVHPYWQPDFRRQDQRPLPEMIDELRALLTDAVALRLMSDVPLGAFLSGGIDSTIIVGLMRQVSNGPVRTFSIGFPVPEYDETRYARLVARRFHTEHEEFQVQPDALAILPKLAWHYDEPFADSSAVPTWYVSQLARQRVTVALTGDGGDELFGGYERYQAVAWAARMDRLPGPLRRMLAAPLWQRLPAGTRQGSPLRRLKRFSQALGLSPVRRYLDWVSIFNASRRAELYSPDFARRLADHDPAWFLEAAWARAGQRDALTAASLADVNTYLPGALMTKVDIASMAHGLETRPPLLDHRVVELAAGIPAHDKLRGFRGKWILRQALADLLPPEIQRRGKQGFGVPLAEWFRGPLRPLAQDVLLDSRTLDRGYFRPEAVRGLLESHVAGRFDHSARLWALLMLELWCRQWGGG